MKIQKLRYKKTGINYLSLIVCFLSIMILTSSVIAQISISVGIPEIISVTSSQFNEGFDGKVDITVTSREGKGSYEIKTVCDSPFNSGEPIWDTIEKDAMKYYSVKISGGIETVTEQIISGTCTVSMRETLTQQKVTQDVDVSFKQQQFCTPGGTRCSDDNENILICSSIGLEETILETCTQSCSIINGEASCERGTTTIGTTTTILIIILPLLGVVGIWYFYKKRKESKK
jgi:hypothetical protein